MTKKKKENQRSDVPQKLVSLIFIVFVFQKQKQKRKKTMVSKSTN